MENGQHVPIEEMEFFRQYVDVADEIWRIVRRWQSLPADTIGKQMVRAIDSVGANLVEGDGRHSGADALHFLVIARASAREARYWIQRASMRNLIPAQEAERMIATLTSATRQLNNLIHYRRAHTRKTSVRESPAAYGSGHEDPFTAE